jgi:AraC family transcriptional regulator of adaptative response / DNA-3-methyladenine glycosylase II
MTSSSLDFESCYRAVRARDARFDGLFFTAVASTGIYCRSVCPARTPLARSCRFYETAAAAEQDGFRPCLRCRPELAPRRGRYAATLAEAILARVQARALEHGTLESLAQGVGLSSRHLRRVLHDAFGVTPIAIIQTERLLFAKRLLHETRLSMTDVALAAGFQSVRRFNALFRARYRLSPSMLRRSVGATNQPRDSIRLRLAFRPPFAWGAALAYLGGRATPGVEAVIDGAYWRTVALDAGPRTLTGWIEVRGVIGEPFLTVDVPAQLTAVLLPLTGRLRALFDLDADPLQIDAQLAVDAALARLVAATPGLRVIGAWDPFELALRAVLGQQISVAGANTLSGRLAQRFGEPVATPVASLTHLAVTAHRLAASTPEDVAAVGLPRSRAATVVALAVFAAAGGLAFPPGVALEEMVARLAALPGIGSWTAQYIAMRAFCQPDAFPAGDLGLKRALPVLDGAKEGVALPSEKALLARSLAWRPWRAYAAAHLWRSASRPGA